MRSLTVSVLGIVAVALAAIGSTRTAQAGEVDHSDPEALLASFIRAIAANDLPNAGRVHPPGELRRQYYPAEVKISASPLAIVDRAADSGWCILSARGGLPPDDDGNLFLTFTQVEKRWFLLPVAASDDDLAEAGFQRPSWARTKLAAWAAERFLTAESVHTLTAGTPRTLTLKNGQACDLRFEMPAGGIAQVDVAWPKQSVPVDVNAALRTPAGVAFDRVDGLRSEREGAIQLEAPVTAGTQRVTLRCDGVRECDFSVSLTIYQGDALPAASAMWADPAVPLKLEPSSSLTRVYVELERGDMLWFEAHGAYAKPQSGTGLRVIKRQWGDAAWLVCADASGSHAVVVDPSSAGCSLTGGRARADGAHPIELGKSYQTRASAGIPIVLSLTLAEDGLYPITTWSSAMANTTCFLLGGDAPRWHDVIARYATPYYRAGRYRLVVVSDGDCDLSVDVRHIADLPASVQRTVQYNQQYHYALTLDQPRKIAIRATCTSESAAIRLIVAQDLDPNHQFARTDGTGAATLQATLLAGSYIVEAWIYNQASTKVELTYSNAEPAANTIPEGAQIVIPNGEPLETAMKAPGDETSIYYPATETVYFDLAERSGVEVVCTGPKRRNAELELWCYDNRILRRRSSAGGHFSATLIPGTYRLVVRVSEKCTVRIEVRTAPSIRPTGESATVEVTSNTRDVYVAIAEATSYTLRFQFELGPEGCSAEIWRLGAGPADDEWLAAALYEAGGDAPGHVARLDLEPGRYRITLTSEHDEEVVTASIAR